MVAIKGWTWSETMLSWAVAIREPKVCQENRVLKCKMGPVYVFDLR